jgi:hypothetical protein
MSLITRSASASLDANQANQFLAGLVAGEDLDLVAPCYIASADGKVYMSNATAADEEAEVVGFTARHVHSGEPVTLFGIGTRYGSSLTPGNVLYLGATNGRLDSGATTGDAFGYALCVSDTDIVVLRAMPVLTSATVGAGSISATELAANSVVTAKILAANVTEAKLEVGAASAGITGKVVKESADGNVIGVIPVLHRIDVAAGSVGNTDVTLTYATRVIDAWVVLRGAGISTTTLQIKNGSNAITDAMAVSGSDQAVVRAASINDAYHEIADSGTLRITTATGASQPDCTVYVLGVRV